MTLTENKASKPYLVYIIQSLSRHRTYVGVTLDVTRRVKEHNAGSAKATRPFGPWKLIYSEEGLSKVKAYKREYYLKHKEGRNEKLELIKRRGEACLASN